MIFSIADQTTQDIFDGLNSKASRRVPLTLHEKARRLLDLLNAAKRLEDMQIPPGNKLEKLKGDRSGFYSVRINIQWRIIFWWQEGNATEVGIIDYHKG